MLTNNKTYKKNNLRDVQKSFNDGICTLFSAYERKIEKYKGSFYFSNESVGVDHFWKAYNNNIEISRSISIPSNSITVDPQDIVNIEDSFYKIVRIQFHDNKKPNYWTLALEKVPFEYEVAHENH